MASSTILPETRLQVALDAAQQSGSDVLTRMNDYGRHTVAAFDAHVRASLPALDTTEGFQDAATVVRGRRIRVAEAPKSVYSSRQYTPGVIDTARPPAPPFVGPADWQQRQRAAACSRDVNGAQPRAMRVPSAGDSQWFAAYVPRFVARIGDFSQEFDRCDG
jgi:hypothetical protein